MAEPSASVSHEQRPDPYLDSAKGLDLPPSLMRKQPVAPLVRTMVPFPEGSVALDELSGVLMPL